MTTHLTELEQDVIAAIKRTDYGDAPNYCTWLWEVATNCTKVAPAQMGGVVASLVKKGLVLTNGESIQLNISEQEE